MATLAARRAPATREGRRWLEMATPKTTTTFSIKGEAVDGVSSFLDNQSTTAMDPRVLDAMMPLLTWQYGNPHSRSHHYGWEAESAVEEARKSVGTMIGADAKEIIFTSGATECNNMAIKGVARFYKAKKKHIITTQVQQSTCRLPFLPALAMLWRVIDFARGDSLLPYDGAHISSHFSYLQLS